MLEVLSPELRAYQEQKLADYQAANAEEETGSLVFAGDSIVEFFPLKKYLGRHRKLINRGIAGTDTIWLSEYISCQVSPLLPSKLFLLIGTNDLGLGRTLPSIVENLSDIVAKLREDSIGTEIYLLSVLPVNEAPIYQDRVKVRRNAAIRELNQELSSLPGVTTIDLYSRLLDDSGNLAENYTTDGLHLSQEGYARLAEFLLPYLD